MSERTTFLRRRADMESAPLPHCHDGRGTLQCTRVLQGDVVAGLGMNFMHDLVLPPGTSVGVHRHGDDEEYYYVVAGSGVMTLDGEQFPVKAGDITAVLPGGEHGLVNDSDAELRIIVTSVRIGE